MLMNILLILVFGTSDVNGERVLTLSEVMSAIILVYSRDQPGTGTGYGEFLQQNVKQLRVSQ
jgi:hypothetical protein